MKKGGLEKGRIGAVHDVQFCGHLRKSLQVIIRIKKVFFVCRFPIFIWQIFLEGGGGDWKVPLSRENLGDLENGHEFYVRQRDVTSNISVVDPDPSLFCTDRADQVPDPNPNPYINMQKRKKTWISTV